jgi:hypothetical protein
LTKIDIRKEAEIKTVLNKTSSQTRTSDLLIKKLLFQKK